MIVTPPDDVFRPGFRILTANLTTDQLNEISLSINRLETESDIIVYVWKNGSDVNWLLDKIYKSNSIFFNADDFDQTLVGFLASQRKSSYFGNLKTIKEVNNSIVFDSIQCTEVLNRQLGIYEQISK